MRMADVALGDHVGIDYDTDEAALSCAVDFTTAGLAGGYRVLHFTHTVAPGVLKSRLAERVPDYVEARTAGQLAIVSTWDFHLARGRFDAERTMDKYRAAMDEAERAGYRGLWVNVDMAFALAPVAEVVDLAGYEVSAQILFSDRRMASVCRYDR